MKGTKFLSSKAILGIVTAVAVVVTVAGSFAAWDKLSDNADTTTPLAMRQAVELVATDAATLSSTHNTTLDTTTTTDVVGTVQFNVTNWPTNKTATLSFTPTVQYHTGDTGDWTSFISTTDYTITIKKDNIGSDLSSSGDTTYAGSGNYTVTISFTNEAKAHVLGNNIQVSVLGTLSALK